MRAVFLKKNVDGLVEKSLVSRSESNDRRVLKIRLTAFATNQFDEFKAGYFAAISKQFDTLSDQEIEQLVALLEKIAGSKADDHCTV